MGRPLHNLVGRRFGRLLVEDKPPVRRRSGDRYRWWCRCDCGTIVLKGSGSLRNGSTKSCGCLQRESIASRSTTHGLSKTSEHHAWSAMIARCTNPTHKQFKDYGGRGIRVAKEWIQNFESFLAHIGPKPSPMHSLDRYPDNNGNYEPGNVRWATSKQQCIGRRSTVWIMAFGQRRTMSDWARKIGMTKPALAYRLKRMSVEDALTTPRMKNYAPRIHPLIEEAATHVRRLSQSVDRLIERFAGGVP